MKILYTINSSKRGGAENHLLDLVEGFYNRGHEIYVWCPAGEMATEYSKAGAVVNETYIESDLDFPYIFKLAEFLRKNKIDVLHAHELKAVGNALIAGFLARTKVKITHTHTPISEWRVSRIKKFINTKLFYTPIVNLLSSREIALTSSRKVVKVREGIKEPKLEIIPNGLKLKNFKIEPAAKVEYRTAIRQRFKINSDDFVFGNVGRLTKEKGTDVLLEAFALLLKNTKVDSEKTKLLIAGGGNLEETLRTRAQELEIEDKVIFTGIFDEKDKIKLYSTFDAFVFPSLAEGFGIVLIEAMAMGLPTIASNLDVLQEVGGSMVIFFETGDFSDLAQKMFNLYSKRDRLDNLKAESKRRVEELYTLDKFIDNYERLYLDLLENY